MTDFYHRLSPGQLERLVVLAEEAAEVIQAIGKIQRYGYDSYTNKLDLEREIGDLLVAVELLTKYDLDRESLQLATHRKMKKINRHLRHNLITPGEFESQDRTSYFFAPKLALVEELKGTEEQP